MNTCILKRVSDVFINFFLFLPRILGGWGGLGLYNACSESTKINDQFWKENEEVCRELIERQAMSAFIGFLFVYCLFILFLFTLKRIK
jgi:hypothetical protein